jgi:hypothetical protein
MYFDIVGEIAGIKPLLRGMRPETQDPAKAIRRPELAQEKRRRNGSLDQRLGSVGRSTLV